MLNDHRKFKYQIFIILVLTDTAIAYCYQNFKILTSYLIAVLAIIT